MAYDTAYRPPNKTGRAAAPRATRRKRRRKRRRARALFLVLLCGMATGLLLTRVVGRAGQVAASGLEGTAWGQPQSAAEEQAPALPPLQLYSANALLVRRGDGQVLLDAEGDGRIYPASMTKLMTALVALEGIADLEAEVLLREEIFADLYSANAATAGFQPGEQVRALDLLYGLLLPSGAECGIALAEHVASSESAFVARMNQKAAELGMAGTHFENTSGLHSPGHYATARDIAVLLEYALQNDTLRAILTAGRHSTAATNLHPGGITFYSTLLAYTAEMPLGAGSILGGKTGYTEEAGQCLASVALIEGQEYILVTAGAFGEREENLHIRDAATVYNAIPGGA